MIDDDARSLEHIYEGRKWTNLFSMLFRNKDIDRSSLTC